jgi:iron complex outermembrane receptor protein
MLRPTLPASALAVLGSLLGASSLPAQTIPPAALPAVEVTGTRLGRPLEESPINFTVVSRETLRDSGRVRLGEVLRELPEFGGNPVADTVAFNESRGTSGFELRGFGNGNTLFLVNGRRTTVNANAFEFTKTYVDLNRFSPAFIERVEILKSGASAVYGADAVGGVVNIITRRQPSGGELAVSYGNTFQTDAAELAASATTGVTRGRLGLSVGLDWFTRHAQAHVDRPFSRSADHTTRFTSAYDFYGRQSPADLAGYDGRQATSANALVRLPADACGNLVPLPGTAGLVTATPNFANPVRTATGGQFLANAAASFVAPELTRGDANARSFYDWNRDIWTLPEANRFGATARLDYDAPGFAVFAEAGGGRNRSRTEYHPRAFSGSVPRTNPYNHFGVDVLVDWRIPDQQRRRALTENDYYTAQLGLRSTAGSVLKWETAATFSRDDYVDVARGVYRLSAVNAALARTDPATALNPFGGRDYRQPTTVLNAITTEAWFGGAADLLVLDAHVSGKLFRLPAGHVQAAAYAEHRHENYSARSDALSRAGDIMGTGSMGADIATSRHVTALAAELSAPLLGPGDSPARAPRLVFEAAARREKFSASFDSGTKPSLGLVARPTADVTVRASLARTFRAPSLPQLFSPQSDTFYNSVPDPRRPAALTGDDNDGPNVPRLVRQGGNPQLGPETGRSLQTGVTWAPRALGGFALEATRFRYDLEDVINYVGPLYVLDHELGGLGSLVHRASGAQSVVNRTTAPIAVLTGPAGATTAIAPGQSTTVPGRLMRVDIYTVNLSRQRLIGWDFGARHAGVLAGGRWHAAASASYTDFASSAYDRLQPMPNYAGSANSPRWRGRTSFDWVRDAWSHGATFNYIASSGEHTAASRYQKPYRTLHLRTAWTSARDSWLRGAQFALGLDDVFDEAPPLYLDHPIGFNTGVIPRPQGRFWRVTVTKTW